MNTKPLPTPHSPPPETVPPGPAVDPLTGPVVLPSDRQTDIPRSAPQPQPQQKR